jgi:hypothetical protein
MGIDLLKCVICSSAANVVCRVHLKRRTFFNNQQQIRKGDNNGTSWSIERSDRLRLRTRSVEEQTKQPDGEGEDSHAQVIFNSWAFT